MPKLKNLSGKDVCKILKRHGFLEMRRRGSHVIMQKRLLYPFGPRTNRECLCFRAGISDAIYELS
ncbi:MAG: hypothetical protein DSZ23_03525 [Thermodesulfatator sp.]|nr:MAG: hypothetical protein DSZ23_03525 [Thermodesulfatator sp.]